MLGPGSGLISSKNIKEDFLRRWCLSRCEEQEVCCVEIGEGATNTMTFRRSAAWEDSFGLVLSGIVSLESVQSSTDLPK